MINSPTHKESKPKTVNTNTPFFTPVIQKKLSIGSANDTYEVEADAMANKVMRMQEPQQQNVSHTGALVQRKCATCEQEEKIQKKSLAESISPLIQRSSTENGSESYAPSHVESQINSSKGGGSVMDHGTKNFMESRFGTNFSDVKIHTGSQAVQMSRELNAQAFTVGNDVYFNEGKYSPNTDSGRHLLAHELTHTVQQSKSPGLAMRRIQRSVITLGGEWDTDQYKLVKKSGGVRGVDIKLRFKTRENVNAELIGLTQSVQAIIGGATVLTPAASTRAIKAIDATSINTGPGETNEGTAIDRASGYNNPIYPTSDPASPTLDDTTVAVSWGQHGWRYKDSTGTLKNQDALLIDSPRRSNAQKDARHIFETTAIATKGLQAGTYYGSVRWGWRTDDKGKFSKIDLNVVSFGQPSPSFMKAAELWNVGKSSTGAENVDLPLHTAVQIFASPVDEILNVNPIASIPVNTRVKLLSDYSDIIQSHIEILEGTNIGVRGYITTIGTFPFTNFEREVPSK